MNNQILNRIQRLVSDNSNTLFVIPSGVTVARSHSVNYPFKVRSDFYYLTGVTIEDAFLVVLNETAFIYRLALDQESELWGESVYDPYQDSTLEMRSGSKDDFIHLIRQFAQTVRFIAAPLGRTSFLDQLIQDLTIYSRSSKTQTQISFTDSTLMIGKLRAIKSSFEIQQMEQAAIKSSAAHDLIMKSVQLAQTEIEIRDHIELEFLKSGMKWFSYETIVGAGSRSTILHARPTRRQVNEHDVVLIDAGGEWNGYCADLTRTFSAGACFTNEQAEIYQLVLDTQKKIISVLKPGLEFSEIDRLAKQFLKTGLQKILKTEDLEIKNFMPHGTSHWIGLDVHDPCPYYDEHGKSVLLQEGMTLTIEPGCYFFSEYAKRFSKFQNIGIRIEDNVVIGPNGARILSNATKELHAIEKLRRG